MPADLLARTLSGYLRIEAFIAYTPQGELYRALDLHQNRRLAVTRLPPEASQPENFKTLEARAARLKKLTHPSLLSFYGLTQDDPQTSCAIESWVDGPSLRDSLLARPGQPFTVSEALTVAKNVCSALDYLHSQGCIHAGLCPERIHLDKQGRIQVSGIGGGLLKDETSLTPLHSPYAAPEQTRAARLTPAADLYALAAILFEMLTGQPPLAEPARPNTLNPEIPDFLARVLLQGLAARPAERFTSAGEFFLTLCMSARLPAESIAEKISPEQAPVSWEVTQTWQTLLPAAENASAPIALRPLEKQLSAAGAPPRRGIDYNRLIRAALVLMLVGLGIFLLWRIQPLPVASAIPPKTTAAVTGLVVPTAAPTLTLPPTPTEVHGGRIVFTCTRGDFNQLCMINADGTHYQQLTNSQSNSYYPVFAPGGAMMVFASNRYGTFDLFLLIFQGGNLSQLTDRIGNVISPDFSPEGQKIVFANRAADGPTSIWTVNRDGSNAKLLYAGPNTIVATAWSPDGLTIAYAMAVTQPTEYEVFLMDTDGTNPRRISSGLQGIGGSLSWSPDSKNLLIFAGPPGDKDIFRLEVETGNFTQLTKGGNNTASNYSPDGKFIVFNSLRNNDQADLFIMNSDGSGVRQLTNNPEPDWQPRWER